MGTRLVYDYQQQKWIPYVSDPDKWYQHLLDVRDGYAERDSHGHYIVGSGRKYRELKEMKSLESKMETQRPVFKRLAMALIFIFKVFIIKCKYKQLIQFLECSWNHEYFGSLAYFRFVEKASISS